MPVAPVRPSPPPELVGETDSSSPLVCGAAIRLERPGQLSQRPDTTPRAAAAVESGHGRAALRAAIAFAFCISAFSILASVLRRHLGFPLDDSWIHQTVARNLVDYGVLGYLPGVHSSGSSSLLWTLVLAFQYKFLPSLDPVLFSAAVNGFLMGTLGAGLKWLTERDGLSPTESWIVALAPALSGNFLWLGMLGMEHVLFCALSVAVICLWFGAGGKGARAGWVHGGSLTVGAAALGTGLLALTRPEGLFLSGVLVLFQRRAGRTWGQSGAVLLAAAAAQGISLRVNWVASHTLLPLTMKGRQWLYFGPQPPQIAVRLAFLRRWVPQAIANWTFPPAYIGSRLEPWTYFFLGLLLAGAVLATAITFYRHRQNRMSALLLWTVFLTLLYVIILPATGHAGRYQPMQMLLFPPLLWIGVKRGFAWTIESVGSAAPRAHVLATAALVPLVLAATALSLHHWRSLSANGIDQIEAEHGTMGNWVQQHLPAQAVTGREIAVFDIGRIGYGLHGSLVDLGGLTDKKYLPYLEDGRVPEYLQTHHVRYVVLPTNPWRSSDPRRTDTFTDLLLRDPGRIFELQPLDTICIPAARAAFVLRGTGAAMPCQTVYAIRFR